MCKMLANNPLLVFQKIFLMVLVISSWIRESHSFVNGPSVLTTINASPHITGTAPKNDQWQMSHTDIMRPLHSSDMDGTDRGVVIQGITLAICVWFFSIPPEFRRAHWCFSDSCVANREKCYDCVTLGEWYHDVSEYYKTGGGVQFNFEVADETRVIFEKDGL
jgi:hypothetical protein